MDKKIKKFEKFKFHQYKCSISIDSIDNNKIRSNKVPFV